MNKATKLTISTLLLFSLLVAVVLCETTTTTSEPHTKIEPTVKPVENIETKEPTVKVELSRENSVEPSYEEHGVFVTDGEEHDKDSKSTTNVFDKTTNDEQQKKDQPIQQDVQQKEKNHEGRPPLFRRDPFRFVNGIWDDMNHEFKSMSTYMNDLFADVLDQDFFSRGTKRDSRRLINDDNNDDDDDDNRYDLFGRNRWGAFNKIFNDFKFDDDFRLDSPFFKRLLGNSNNKHKQRHNRINERIRAPQENGNKIVEPLKDTLVKTENSQSKSKDLSPSSHSGKDIAQRSVFLGGITEGTKGYQVQLEIPDHLTKNDVKVSVRKVHNNLSVVNIKGEKTFEQNSVGSINSDINKEGNGQVADKSTSNDKSRTTTKVYQSFERVFTIGRPILKENIEAKLENGILNVFIPKDQNVQNDPSDVYQVNIM